MLYVEFEILCCLKPTKFHSFFLFSFVMAASIGL